MPLARRPACFWKSASASRGRAIEDRLVDGTETEPRAHQRHAIVAHAELQGRAGGDAHQRRVVEMLAQLGELGLEPAIALMRRVVGCEYGAGIGGPGQFRKDLGGGGQRQHRCQQLGETAWIDTGAAGVTGIEHGQCGEPDIGFGETALVARLEGGEGIVGGPQPVLAGSAEALGQAQAGGAPTPALDPERPVAVGLIGRQDFGALALGKARQSQRIGGAGGDVGREFGAGRQIDDDLRQIGRGDRRLGAAQHGGGLRCGEGRIGRPGQLDLRDVQGSGAGPAPRRALPATRARRGCLAAVRRA